MTAFPVRVSTGSGGRSRFNSVLTLDSLITLVQGVARQSDIWRPAARVGTRGRHSTWLHRDEQVEVWLTTWLPSSETGRPASAPHTHGDSIEVFTVVEGALLEERIDRDGQLLVSRLTPSVIRPVAPHLTHDLRNASDVPTISIHAATTPVRSAARVVPALNWPRQAAVPRPHARTA